MLAIRSATRSLTAASQPSQSTSCIFFKQEASGPSFGGVPLPGSLIQSLSLPNTAYITNQYDPLARLTGTFLVNSGGVTLDYASYDYNLASQRTNFTSGPGTVSYGYDKIGQLKVATSTVGGESRGYAYDPAWNLNWLTNGSTYQFQVDTKNELTNAYSSTYSYDGNGKKKWGHIWVTSQHLHLTIAIGFWHSEKRKEAH
jgi:hypothetical protein